MTTKTLSLAALCAVAITVGQPAQASDTKGTGAIVPRDYVPHLEHYSDGSISWNQPASTLYGYNGFCGHTAWANAVSMYSGKKYDPSYFRNYSWGDATPGLQPGTLTKALNKATATSYGVRWQRKSFHPVVAWQMLKAAVHQTYYGLANTPLPRTGLENALALVVVQSGYRSFHWLTVTEVVDNDDKSKAYVTVVENGYRRDIPYRNFMKAWAFEKSDSNVVRYLSSSGFLGRFTAILPKT